MKQATFLARASVIGIFCITIIISLFSISVHASGSETTCPYKNGEIRTYGNAAHSHDIINKNIDIELSDGKSRYLTLSFQNLFKNEETGEWEGRTESHVPKDENIALEVEMVRCRDNSCTVLSTHTVQYRETPTYHTFPINTNGWTTVKRGDLGMRLKNCPTAKLWNARGQSTDPIDFLQSSRGFLSNVSFTAALTKPKGFSVEVVNTIDGTVRMEWENPNDYSIGGYQYQQKENNGEWGEWTTMDDSDADTISHTVTGLSYTNTYSFKIRSTRNGATTVYGPQSDVKTVGATCPYGTAKITHTPPQQITVTPNAIDTTLGDMFWGLVIQMLKCTAGNCKDIGKPFAATSNAGVIAQTPRSFFFDTSQWGESVAAGEASFRTNCTGIGYFYKPNTDASTDEKKVGIEIFGGVTNTVPNTNVNEDDEEVSPVNNAPVFTEGSATTRSVAENTAPGQNIGNPVTATDADSDTLTYSLSGVDAASFGIIASSGQLQTKAALDYESEKKVYLVTVTASDGEATNSSTVTINVTDVDETTEDETTTTTRKRGGGGGGGGAIIPTTEGGASRGLSILEWYWHLIEQAIHRINNEIVKLQEYRSALSTAKTIGEKEKYRMLIRQSTAKILGDILEINKNLIVIKKMKVGARV